MTRPCSLGWTASGGILRVLFAALVPACLAGQVHAAAAITGTTNSGQPNAQVAISFTLTGDGVTKSIGGVFNLPSELSFVGSPTGAVPPLQCTSGGISWTNTGSPIPANAGTCVYQVKIAANATVGAKSVPLIQASCDSACTFNPGTVNVTAAANPPAIAYNPNTSSTVSLSGGPGTIGSAATASIVATPSGGSGSGGAATTTISACGISGTGAGAFGTPPGTLSFVGSTTTSQNLSLTCTRAAAQQSATLSCTDTRGGSPGTNVSWPLTCPAGSVVNTPPTLQYSPTSGGTVTLTGGNTAIGASATGRVTVTPSAGSGSGAPATTTVSSCGITGAGAAAFGSPPSALNFVGTTTSAQNLNVSCTRAENQAQATLACTESAPGQTNIGRSWSLTCPSGTATVTASVSLSASPARLSQAGTVSLSWVPQGTTSCALAGGQPGTVFAPTGANSATTTVTPGTTARNDVFTVTCTGPGVSASASATVAVGVPAPPPPKPVTTISTGVNGAVANGGSSKVSLSDGGTYVAFESTASNLVADDTNGTSDVFVRNTVTGEVRRASVDGNGVQSAAVSGEASISRDGRYVAFTRGTGSTPAGADGAKSITGGEVCIRDLQGNVIRCINKSPGGAPANGASSQPVVSGDGDVVVYQSDATNLTDAPDVNGSASDVFVYDNKTGNTTLLAKDTSDAPLTQPSTAPFVSCNGLRFAFESLAQVSSAPQQAGVKNIVVISQYGGKRVVSLGLGGVAANGDSRKPVIDDDGRYVAFESDASNLVVGDSNNATDVFLVDLSKNITSRMSVAPNGTQGNGASRSPKMSCDGSSVTFESLANNLVADDANGELDSFVANVGTGSVAMISRTNAGGGANGASGNGAVSPDGSFVGFDSRAPNLGATSQGTVFGGQNPFASQNFTGAWYDPNQNGHGIFLDQLTDGRLVAWWFTFDPTGAQAWFGGVGNIQGNSAVVSVVRTLGTRFAPNFNPAEIVNTPIGTLTFNFTACDRGRVDFALDATFGTGFMNLTRLTTPLGVGCTPSGTSAEVKALSNPLPGVVPEWLRTKASESTVGPIAGVTGAWFDPNQNGQGLFLENLGNGRLLAWWFTFGPTGNQAWFGGVGTLLDSNRARINVVKTEGGRWIPNFNSALINNVPVGTLDLTFPACTGGQVAYVLQQGFGTGVLPLSPLVRPVGTVCIE